MRIFGIWASIWMQAANPVFQRCEIARDVNVQVGAVRIGHGVALELVDILKFEELVCDCGLQDP